MNPRTSFRHFGVPARFFVFLATTGFIVGCAGGPKLSLTSPSTWPGAKQVTRAGKEVGGWVAEKTNLKRTGKKTQAAALARKEPSQAKLAHESNSKRRSIFTQENWSWSDRPSDPFLAQTAQAQRQVESVSHSSDETDNDRPASDRHASDFPSAAHAVDGPQDPTPETPAPTESNVNPFADLANSGSTSKAKISEKRPDDNSFAGGIDTQLAQLRQQADDRDASKATDVLPVESNALRDAILGIADDATPTRRSSLPSDVDLPADEINKPAGVTETPIGRAVLRASDMADDVLPEWARESAAEPASRDSLPTENTASVTNRQIEPAAEASVSPFENSPASDRVRVATNVDQSPPTAIEIVPSPVNVFAQPPSEPPAADAAQRVELLSPPADAVDVEERGSFEKSGDSFGGMIFESETLPPGFAEWHGNGTHATLRTNTPLAAQTARLSSGANVPARLAVSSRRTLTNPTTAETDIDNAHQTPNVVQPRFLREIPSPAPVADEAAGAGQETTSTSEPRLFRSTAASEQALENSLESVSWDPETEPGAAAGSSLFESTAVIGLLIGLVCMIGLALFRRMRSTA